MKYLLMCIVAVMLMSGVYGCGDDCDHSPTGPTEPSTTTADQDVDVTINIELPD